MAKLQFVREATICNNGLRLEVEVEFYKTVAKVYIIDDALAYSCVDSYKVKGNSRGFDFTQILFQARAHAIKKGYFKHH
ncbi:MAG: hypothetical protein IJF63_08460 [Alistipes sp.]|nr:hypothetical protein [Alistipes sp.]